MMEQIFNWENKIEVSLTLWELQMIRDALAISNDHELRENFNKNNKYNLNNPYLNKSINSMELYSDLETILKKNGGVVDEFIRN